jgi:hypothetical protein
MSSAYCKKAECRVYRTEVHIVYRKSSFWRKLMYRVFKKGLADFKIEIRPKCVKITPKNFPLLISLKFEFGAILTVGAKVIQIPAFFMRANFEKIFAPPDSSWRKTSNPGISFTNNEREGGERRLMHRSKVITR